MKTQKTKTVQVEARKSGMRGAGSGKRRWGRWLLALWLLLVVWVTVEYVRLPDVRPLARDNPRTTALMEQRAEEAREEGRKPRQRQTWVPLSAVPPHAVASILLSEDARFYEHDGVDWVEVEDALGEAWEHRALGRGASTLTQQLAKNLYLSTDRSLLRKGKEYVLARRLEAELPKKRILTLYVNVVEWGDGVYGIEAAAREHFGRSASHLSVAQGALLASMLPAPRRWLPARRPVALRKRAVTLIGRLERFGRITPAQAMEARAELSRFFGGAAPAPVPAAPEDEGPEDEEPELEVPEDEGPEDEGQEQEVPEQAAPEKAAPEKAEPAKRVPAKAVPAKAVPEQAAPERQVEEESELSAGAEAP
jgi:monofunctional glycosyltransferase